MPEFLDDPSVLTKDKLKSQLVANNVSLPAGEQRKDVYVKLYLEHLTPRNRVKNRSPDFSSDEEREATPIPVGTNPLGRNRPGRKATKKTDKPRPEENTDPDIAKLSNEDLKEELLKYGVISGPILASTRKVYEKKLAKLVEQGPEILTSTQPPTVSSTEDDTKQNGNTDSEYSDNEEESRISLKLEKREPLKSKLKTPLMFNQQRVEQNEIVDAVIPELNIKRSNRPPPKAFTQDEPVWNYTEPTFTEPDWTSGFSESGPLKVITKESSRVSRKTSRKRMGTAEQLPFDDAVITESTPIAETISSSNQTLAHSEYEQFESRQAINKVPGNFKSTAPVLSFSEFSDMSGRTPKKPMMKEEVVRKTLNEERRTNKDILKEMFPYEVSTPTGISASCRRPIRGAAGRPIELSDYRMEESVSSRFVPKYAPLADVKPERAKKGRSIPIWIKILLFIAVAIFLFLVYQAMETNQGNPFAPYLGTSDGSNVGESGK
uniref:Thymopoietin isoform X5 n=1 Tax=Geotrypetes seraphini TaxID=260995 RepID=A0A6P8RQT4_GEOSA|nr:thymopoietin isoform X5 [Geotrypetes seraphini]